MRRILVLLPLMLVFLFGGVVNAGIINDLVAYYPFNGNADDESGTGNSGSVHGATLAEDRFGNSDSAYFFDSSENDYINCGNSNSFNFYDAVTFSAWVKIDEDGSGYVIGKKKPGHENKYIRIKANTKQALSYFYHTTPEVAVKSDPIPLDVWVHLASTYDGSKLKIYVNGDFARDMDASGNVADSNAKLFIGGDGTSGLFNGYIDDVRIYKRALSAADIVLLYNDPMPYNPVPVPAAAWLLGSGLIGLAGLRRRMS